MLDKFNVPSAAYNSFRSTKSCDPDTRLDVIDKIMAWADGTLHRDRRICWLYGQAGLGKSAIAHTIARKLDAPESPDDQNRRLIGTFVFYRDAEEERRTTDRLFPTLAYQLAISIPESRRILFEALDKDGQIPKQRLDIQFEKLFFNPATSFEESSDLFVVIDGLDECLEVDALQFIDLLLDSRPSLPVRFLLTGRNEGPIHARLTESRKAFPIDLLEYNASNDIRKFLEVQLPALLKKWSKPIRPVEKPWPPRDILQKIVEKSKGVFQYATTLVEFVRWSPGVPEEILKSAAEGHPGLDSLYKQVLRVARRTSIRDFKSILGALVVLRKPISIKALAALMGFTSTLYIGAGLRGCEPILLMPMDQAEPISFYHASLRDFFMDQGRSGGEGFEDFFIDPIEHHIYMLKYCMQIMTNELQSLSRASNGESRSSSGDTNTEVELELTSDADKTELEVQSNASHEDEQFTPGDPKEDNGGEGRWGGLVYACENLEYHMMNVVQAEKGLARRPLILDLLAHLPEFITRLGTRWFEAYVKSAWTIYAKAEEVTAVALIAKACLDTAKPVLSNHKKIG